MNFKFGIRYRDGKFILFKGHRNPGEMQPAWAVDVREIIAMIFVGVGALAFIASGDVEDAKALLVGLLCYATGRTVPGGVQKKVES